MNFLSLRIIRNSLPGSQNLEIRAFDGTDWSDWSSFQLTTTQKNTKPILISLNDVNLEVNENVKSIQLQQPTMSISLRSTIKF